MSEGWVISIVFIAALALILWLVISNIKDVDDDF